ncbi:MAG: AMP-binding protein, partial [Silicimonas sp.]|nr:AMP-binding protein [Silicimonas sp.]
NRAADAIAQGLRNAGFEEGDRIAILCLNRIEFFLTLFACQKTGMILCPLNWRQPAAELVETLEPIDARLILHSGDFAEVAREIGADLGVPVFDIDGDMPNWLALDPEPSTDLIPGHRPWYLLFTSGTTGRPKAVIQTATMAWANALNIGQAIDLVSTDRSVNFLPLFHTAGINLHTLPVFLFGGFSRILPKFEPETLLDLFRAGEITQFLGVPAIYQAFSLAESLDGIDWTRATLSCGGAPLPEPLIRFFADRGAVVLNGFGMTE